MRTLTALCIVCLLGLFVRVAYFQYSGGSMIYEPDSQGYYVERNFFTDDFLHNFFDKFRTPGYRLITGLVMAATGTTTPLYNSQEFFTREMPILYIQMIAGLCGLLFLFDMLRRLKIPLLWNALFTGFTAVNVYQFMWERAFLTEALFIFLLTVSLWLFVRLMEKPVWTTAIAFLVISWYEFLIRPGGSGIPLLTLPFVFVMHRTKKVFVMTVVILCLYTALPMGYAAMNKLVNKYPGVSMNTDIAIFGIFLTNNVPVEAAKTKSPLLYNEVTAFREAGGNTSIPWYFFVAHNNDIFDRADELKAFNRAVVNNQLPRLAQIAAREIPIAFWDTYMYEVPFRNTGDPLHYLFDGIDRVITILQRGSIVFLLTVPLTLWIFIKKQSRIHAFLVSLTCIELYQLLASVTYGGSWEFARHMIVTQTYLFFVCFWWLGQIVLRVRARLLRQQRNPPPR